MTRRNWPVRVREFFINAKFRITDAPRSLDFLPQSGLTGTPRILQMQRRQTGDRQQKRVAQPILREAHQGIDKETLPHLAVGRPTRIGSAQISNTGRYMSTGTYEQRFDLFSFIASYKIGRANV